ncbi:MAG: hypothetical protein ACYDCL_23920 [Myxococcales bacterium]
MRLSPLAVSSLAALACAPAVVVAPTPVPPLEVWAQNHSAASQALGLWVRNHSPAAAWMFGWDSRHPGKAEALVAWTLAHPGERVPVFVAQHPDWPEFNQFAMSHLPAVHNFFEWCLRFPAAARSLVAHPGGLHWAGDHLYGAEWHLANPGA